MMKLHVHANTYIVELLLVPLPAVSLYTRDRDCTLFEAREERLLGLLRRQRIILRLADALIVMDSRLVIRVENMVTTSSFEVLGADLNGTMSNYMRLVLLILLSLLLVACLCRSYKRLRRKLLYMCGMAIVNMAFLWMKVLRCDYSGC